MRNISVEVKSQKKTIAVIDVEQFEELDEAIQTLGEPECLALINRQYKADKANKKRAELTSEVKPETKLLRAAKEDPRIARRIEEMLQELGIR